MIRRVVLLGLFATVAAGVYALLPPPPRDIGAVPGTFTAPVRGVIHVHTTESDGSGTPESIAAAAAAAGLKFVILTDHGDALGRPAAPAYFAGVLCIHGVEVTTENGHMVVIGLPELPYPLGGEARDVIDDVHRVGAFGIAAHPVSPRPGLRWNEWTAPFDGLEWLNGDSEWRDETPLGLARVLLTYPFRPAASLASMLDRSELAMRRWDVLTLRRRVVAVAASDAHGRIGFNADEPLQARIAVPLPGYASVFRTFSIALPNVVLTGRADEDARAVVKEIHDGHVYSVIDAVAGPAAFAFSATSGGQRAVAGDVLKLGGPVNLRVDLHGPEDARVSIMKNGMRVHSGSGSRIEFVSNAEPAIYRVEVEVPGSPGSPAVPWIVSNPIYVGLAPDGVKPPARAPAKQSVPLERSMPTWTIEHSAESQGAVNVTPTPGGRQALFRYALSGVPSAGPYAALVVPMETGIGDYDRLTFRARADRPMRLSVQLRVPGEGNGERWHRSAFIDTTLRDISVFFDEMTPSGQTRTPTPPLAEIRSILFVVDTVNARVGTSGQIAIDNLRYEK